MNSKIIINTIFYIILTSFFLYLLLKEKSLEKKLKEKTDSITEKLFKIDIEDSASKKVKIIKKIVSTVVNLLVCLALVLVIQRFYIGNFVIPTGSMIPTIEIGDRLFADMVSYKFRLPRRNESIVFKEPIQNKVLYTKRAMGLPGEKINISNGKLYINGKTINERSYSNLGIENASWVVPKKGDKLVILPATNYNNLYKSYNIDIEKVQEELAKNPSEVKTILPQLQFILNGQETGMILDYMHDDKIIKDILEGKAVELTIDDDYILALGDNTNHSFDSRMWGFVKMSRIRGRAILRFWPLNRIGIIK